MEAILEQLGRSPRLRLYVDELNEMLRREAEARARFRESLDEDVRAEFINGEVVVLMTSRDAHTTAVANIGRLVHVYAQLHRLGVVRTEQALTGFSRNDYAPDVCFWSTTKAAVLAPRTTVYPVPDFICEVLSESTEARDRGLKFDDYAGHGVGEYWLADPERRSIEQFILRGQRYEPAGTFTAGVIHSSAIAGFAMPVEAAFDEQANLNAIWALKPGPAGA